ncbi:MAG: penicillin-binding protein 2 [Actinomycetia bacterium]|nr:penicillin-binding protein 2 [Actinomycetes bacterium]
MSASAAVDHRVRLSIVGVIVVALFCALLTRLWYLQVASADTYAAVAQTNNTRVVYTEAPRGRILDDQGRVLVDNRVSYAITVDRKIQGKQLDGVVSRLSPLLALTPAQIKDQIANPRASVYKPAPVKLDVSYDTVSMIKEHPELFPGVDAAQLPVRQYPNGSVAANILGYVGDINAKELAAKKGTDYQPDETVGRAGVEASFQDELRGTPGKEIVEVDATGRVIRTVSSTAPKAGHDVKLTIDLDAQKLAEESLQQGILAARGQRAKEIQTHFVNNKAPAGAVVVLDAATGSVVAMASNPTYDPSQLTNGITSNLWAQLQDPNNNNPLTDRALTGAYAPGSTFKLVTAIAGVEGGLISGASTINDTGSLKVANETRYNDGHAAYGRINLSRAITVSSDVFFYKIGLDFWQLFHRNDPKGNTIQDTAKKYGFGSDTGIALPGEYAGRVPDAAWVHQVHTANPVAFPYDIWLPGQNVNLAVGQGDLTVTPLQLANAYATFANGGTRYVPRIASEIENPGGTVSRSIAPAVATTTGLDPGARSVILQGLTGVVADSKGTAFGAFNGFPLNQVSVAGKTGTAQVTGKGNSSVFVAITPVQNPKYVVVSLIEEAGYGASDSAPVVRRVIEGLNGMPTPPVSYIQTTSQAN